MFRFTQFFRLEATKRSLHYFAFFSYLGLSLGIYGPTIPDLAKQTHVTIGQMGTIFLMSSIGVVIGNLLGGKLFEKVKGHLVIGSGQVVSALLILLIPVIPSFWMLMALLLIKGIAEGMMITGGNLLLVWTHGKDVGPYLVALHFSAGLGAFFGPFLFGAMGQIKDGYMWCYWIIGAIGMVIAAKLLFLKGSPTPDINIPVTTEQKPIKINPIVYLAAFYLFFYVGIERTYSSWIYTVATNLNLMNASGAAYLNSAYWLFFTVGRLLSIFISTKIKPQIVLPIALISCIACMAVIVAFPPNAQLLWVITACFGFFMAPLWPMGYTLAGNSLKLTAKLNTIIMMGDNFGGMLLPWIVGQIIDFSGSAIVFTIVLVGSVLTLITCLSMIRTIKKQMAYS